MAFDKAGDGFKTMMGVDVATAVERMVALRVDAVGFNCGTVTLDEYVALAEQFVAAVKETGKNVSVCAEPNAGKPELEEGRAVYRVTAGEFAAAVEKIRDAGVSIIGGCCGTSPEHIEAVVQRFRE
jgi:5-methyltetrahydrofolate--homocysteine methyltransferase